MPRSGIAGSYGNSIFSFWGTSILFSIVAAPIYIPTNNVGRFPLRKSYFDWEGNMARSDDLFSSHPRLHSSCAKMKNCQEMTMNPFLTTYFCNKTINLPQNSTIYFQNKPKI